MSWYYYNNYLPILCEAFGREMPNKEEYLKQIHSNVSTSLFDIQEKYYKSLTRLLKSYKFYKLDDEYQELINLEKNKYYNIV